MALAGTLGVALYTVILCVVRSRRFGPEGTAGILRLSLLCLAFCLPATAAAYAAQWYVGCVLSMVMHPLWRALLQILAAGCAFLPVYLGLARLLAPSLLAPLNLLWSKACRRKKRQPL